MPTFSSPDPDWLARARKCVGLKEIPGAKNNPTIMAVLDMADGVKDGKTVGANNDDEAYCAKGVSAILEMCGIRSTRSAWARSYAKWGQELDGPALGAVVVFWRQSIGSTLGHVGFVAGKDSSGNVMCLGFNQGDSIKISAFSPHRVLSFRWPDGQPKPKTGWATLPLLKSDGTVSTNEA